MTKSFLRIQTDDPMALGTVLFPGLHKRRAYPVWLCVLCVLGGEKFG